MRALLRQVADLDDAELGEWFGRAMTRYRNPGLLAAPPKPLSLSQLRKRLAAGAQLVRHPFTRMAWRPEADGAKLYALGETLDTSPALAQTLCAQLPSGLPWFDALSGAEQSTVVELLNLGHLALERETP